MKRWNLYAAAVLAAVGILGAAEQKCRNPGTATERAGKYTGKYRGRKYTSRRYRSKRSRVQSRNREKWHFICDLCKIPVKCAKYRRAGSGDLRQCIWSNGL